MSRSNQCVRPVFVLLRSLLATIVLGLAVVSCARSPQIVVLSPHLADRPGNSAQQRTVELVVRDGRRSKVIGSRGGLNSDASTISTEDDITLRLTKLVGQKLEDQGYTVVGPRSGGEVKLTVELQKLTYEMIDSLFTEIKVSSTVAVTCSKGGDTLTSRYEANRRDEFPTIPNEKQNSELINSVVGRSLDEVLGDEKLMAFMSK